MLYQRNKPGKLISGSQIKKSKFLQSKWLVVTISCLKNRQRRIFHSHCIQSPWSFGPSDQNFTVIAYRIAYLRLSVKKSHRHCIHFRSAVANLGVSGQDCHGLGPRALQIGLGRASDGPASLPGISAHRPAGHGMRAGLWWCIVVHCGAAPCLPACSAAVLRSPWLGRASVVQRSVS